MAPRDSLPVCDQPDQAPDPLIALVRLLARQAAAEALHHEENGKDAGVPGGARRVDTPESGGEAASAGGRRE
jgi:hypothetical protein